jgi:hypothetical protein
MLVVLGVAGVVLVTPTAGYPTYTSGCNTCHGDFDGPVSPKGTKFPDDSKHEMHRANQAMNTDCQLCHTSIGDDPFIGSSAGTNNNPGVGCTGCHGRDYGGAVGNSGVGLRAHHLVSGVTVCLECHDDDPEPLPESVWPTYFGTPDTNAFDSCNEGPGFGENWSVGDTEGLDNDGDDLYDGADPDCIDAPECVGDTDGDGDVDVSDLTNVILLWGTDGQAPGVDADTNNDGVVNVSDLTDVILGWGACP